MARYALSRLAQFLPTLFVVLSLSFFLVHLVPGDPVDQILGEQATELERTQLRQQLGLEATLGEQFLNQWSHILHFDLGRSLFTRNPVSSDLARSVGATFELGLTAAILALLWGLPLGVVSAVQKNPFIIQALDLIGILGISIPAVFLGPILVYVFSIQLGLFPVSERSDWRSLVLPAVSLAIPLGAVILKMTTAAVQSVLNEDYLRTAKAKGASPMRLLFVHALRNALSPIITVVGLQLGAVLTGTVITESLFDWPGLGLLMLNSIQRRDYPMIQGCVIAMVLLYMSINLLTDLVYALSHPRLRMEEW